MFGALYGDVIGSSYELRCSKDYNFDMFKSDTSFTDDSVLTAAVCEAILENPEKMGFFGFRKRAREYAAKNRKYYARYPYAGYGQKFAMWAYDRTARHVRSYGNGASMRAVPFGYAYTDIEEIKKQVRASCYYTHRHREAIKGAQAVAVAVRLALDGKSKEEIKTAVEKLSGYDLSVKLDDIREKYVFNSRTSYSVPPAIIAFLESDDYESAVRLAISMGGDADTMACIAGGIAEAYYREIPESIEKYFRPKIDISLRKTVEAFEEKYGF